MTVIRSDVLGDELNRMRWHYAVIWCLYLLAVQRRNPVLASTVRVFIGKVVCHLI